MFRKCKLPIILVVLLLAGCASYDISQVDVRSVEEYEHHLTEQGMGFAADPYDTTDRTEGTFDEDLTDDGYFPVNLIFKNGISERMLILKETIQLADIHGQAYRPVRAAVMAQDFEDNAMTYGLLGFGIFSYASAEEANRERESDWFEKEIPDSLIINPGRVNGGFVYFKLPEEGKLAGSTLQLVIELMESNQKVTLRMPL